MKQETMLQNYKDVIPYNLNDENILKLCTHLLDNISCELYENGYTKESNELTTALLIIKEVLNNEK